MICTFYSFKGGVGRSMALANVAHLLQDAGLRVLIVDWDLEAPGIERFFDTPDRVLEHAGLIDLLQAYKRALSPRGGRRRKEERPTVSLPAVEDFTLDLTASERGPGRLRIMPAGRRDGDAFEAYAELVRTFDWQDFYENWEGEVFVEWLRKEMLRLADVVLVDSRTGVTEMGGICTYHLADLIVMLAAPNQQNLNGTAQMARNFRDPDLPPLRGGRQLELLFVPTRVEDRAEHWLLTRFKADFRAGLEPFFPQRWKQRDTFWDLKVPHMPYYAFNEAVAVRAKDAAGSEPLVTAYTRLVREMAEAAPADSIVRDRILRPGGAGYDAFLVYSHDDREVVERLAVRMRDEAGVRVFLDVWAIAPGDAWAEVSERAVRQSASVVVFIGSDPVVGEWLLRPIDEFRPSFDRPDGVVIIPVLLPTARADQLPEPLRRRQAVRLNDLVTDRAGFQALCEGILRATGRQAPAATPDDSAVSQIQEAWSRADAYADQARRTGRLDRAFAAVAGATAVVAGVLLAFVPFVPAGFPFGVVVMACGLALVAVSVYRPIARRTPVEEMRAARAAIIREIFHCRTRVGTYRADARQAGSRGQLLLRHVRAIEEQVARSTMSPVPKPPLAAVTGDARVSDLSADQYVEERLRPEIEYHRRRSGQIVAAALGPRSLVLILVAGGVFAAALGQWAAGAVLLLFGAILTGFVETRQPVIEAARLTRTAAGLEALMVWWTALPPEGRNRDAFEKVATDAEALILAASGSVVLQAPGVMSADVTVVGRV